MSVPCAPMPQRASGQKLDRWVEARGSLVTSFIHELVGGEVATYAPCKPEVLYEARFDRKSVIG